jgi:hypothetical protein
MILFHTGTGTYFDANDGVVVVAYDDIDNAPEGYEMEEIADEFGTPFHMAYSRI